jgi:Kef-type K+ transport system membrane component KefB
MDYLPHILALIIGVFLLWLVKRKYRKIHNRELFIVFILFLILVAIFTAPGMDLIKKFINFIQVE